MGVGEVVRFDGVGGALTGLVRLWKSVEKLKAPPSKTEGGAPALE
jgi:hypothetical protein